MTSWPVRGVIMFWTAAWVVVGGADVAVQQPTFSSRIDTVRVDVAVLDGVTPVSGLRAEDFELLDNGVPQRVELLGFEEAPMSVMLALDMSRSVEGRRLDQLRAASARVTSALAPTDMAGLITFAERVLIQSPLTVSRQPFSSSLTHPPDGGDTSLVDASYSAITSADDGTGRPLVIIFSDGTDTASFLTPALVLNAAKRLGPVVYAVTSTGLERGGFLEELVRTTGGRRLDAVFDRLGETFAAILDESRQRYLLSFSPAGVAPGGWHEITVRIRTRAGLQVRARSGYLAGP